MRSQTYLQGKDYYPYIGRGFVLLTWEENYLRAGEKVDEDLVGFPDMALEPDIAAAVMFDGMEEGWFTGVSLFDYFNDTTDDPVNARRIINGTDRASEIANYHVSFSSRSPSRSSNPPAKDYRHDRWSGKFDQGRLIVRFHSGRHPFLAGPCRERCPCSQFWSVPTGTPMRLAKAGCDSPVFCERQLHRCHLGCETRRN